MTLWLIIGAITAITVAVLQWRDERPSVVRVIDVVATLIGLSGVILLGPISVIIAVVAELDDRITGGHIGEFVLWRRK